MFSDFMNYFKIVFRKNLILVIVITLILVSRIFIFEFSTVNGISMYPTFNDEDKILVDRQIYKLSSLDRFDVIVFEANILNEDKFLIKRLIAFENETVEVKDHVLYINGVADMTYTLLDADTDDFGPITVPSNSYFVMGDNRQHSTDSRSDLVGVVNKDAILGKVLVRYYFELEV